MPLCFALKSSISSWSCGSALRVLLLCLRNLRGFSWSWGNVLHELLLHLEIANLGPLQEFTLRVQALYVNVAIAQPELRECAPHLARRRSEALAISAEGSPSSRLIRAAPRRERFDTHHLRKGVCQDTFARHHRESASSASTRTIPAQASPSSRQSRAAPQRERFDTNDFRRGFAERKTLSHGATARALRRRRSESAQSPQRVRRAQDAFTRRHSESASTSVKTQSASMRTIPAEGSLSSPHHLQMSETLRLPRKSQNPVAENAQFL